MPIIIGVTAAGRKMAGFRVMWKVVNFLANFLPAVHFIKEWEERRMGNILFTLMSIAVSLEAIIRR